ncbi:MAG: hypothetical protein O8C58_01050 [Candidatus Methanoperedens sp.]|nr:hypothetical protein [Candidatus Methanoperedens sp.]
MNNPNTNRNCWLLLLFMILSIMGILSTDSFSVSTVLAFCGFVGIIVILTIDRYWYYNRCQKYHELMNRKEEK